MKLVRQPASKYDSILPRSTQITKSTAETHIPPSAQYPHLGERCLLAELPQLWSADALCQHGAMDEVIIGLGTPSAVFRSIDRGAGNDPYAAEGFVFELRADGLQIARHVFMFSFDWDALAAFFVDLADSWRGWDGEESWRSIEHDLSITATSDGGRHVNLEFTVRDGSNGSWSVTAGGFSIDAGEDMTTAARNIRAWIVA